MTHDDQTNLETINAEHISRLDAELSAVRQDVGEIKTDVAALPGRIIQRMQDLHKPQSPDKSWQWAFGLIASLGAAILWGVWVITSQSVASTQEQLHLHTFDKHPTRVEARVGELKEKLNALKDTTEREYLQRDEYERQQAADKLQLATRLANTRVEVATEISRLVARQELLLQGMVESMKLGGGAGRHAAENRGRTNEAIEFLQSEIDHLRQRHGANNNE